MQCHSLLECAAELLQPREFITSHNTAFEQVLDVHVVASTKLAIGVIDDPFVSQPVLCL